MIACGQRFEHGACALSFFCVVSVGNDLAEALQLVKSLVYFIIVDAHYSPQLTSGDTTVDVRPDQASQGNNLFGNGFRVEIVLGAPESGFASNLLSQDFYFVQAAVSLDQQSVCWLIHLARGVPIRLFADEKSAGAGKRVLEYLVYGVVIFQIHITSFRHCSAPAEYFRLAAPALVENRQYAVLAPVGDCLQDESQIDLTQFAGQFRLFSKDWRRDAHFQILSH